MCVCICIHICFFTSISLQIYINNNQRKSDYQLEEGVKGFTQRELERRSWGRKGRRESDAILFQIKIKIFKKKKKRLFKS